jgi:hypothetical protein
VASNDAHPASATSIVHVCLFRLKRSLTPGELERLRAFERNFANSDGCRHYRFSENVSKKSGGYGFVLVSAFASLPALRAYVAMPEHAALADFMDQFVEDTIVSDTLGDLR